MSRHCPLPPKTTIKRKRGRKGRSTTSSSSEGENDSERTISSGSDDSAGDDVSEEEVQLLAGSCGEKESYRKAVFHTLESLSLFAGVPNTVKQFFDGSTGTQRYFL